MRKLLLIAVILIVGCNQQQTKTVDEKVEEMEKKVASQVADKPKVVEQPKVYKTTAYECWHRPYPLAPSPIQRIPKGVKLEIENSRKEGKVTWYWVTYEGKRGCVRGTFFRGLTLCVSICLFFLCSNNTHLPL